MLGLLNDDTRYAVSCESAQMTNPAVAGFDLLLRMAYELKPQCMNTTGIQA